MRNIAGLRWPLAVWIHTSLPWSSNILSFKRIAYHVFVNMSNRNEAQYEQSGSGCDLGGSAGAIRDPRSVWWAPRYKYYILLYILILYIVSSHFGPQPAKQLASISTARRVRSTSYISPTIEEAATARSEHVPLRSKRSPATVTGDAQASDRSRSLRGTATSGASGDQV